MLRSTKWINIRRSLTLYTPIKLTGEMLSSAESLRKLNRYSKHIQVSITLMVNFYGKGILQALIHLPKFMHSVSMHCTMIPTKFLEELIESIKLKKIKKMMMMKIMMGLKSEKRRYIEVQVLLNKIPTLFFRKSLIPQMLLIRTLRKFHHASMPQVFRVC